MQYLIALLALLLQSVYAQRRLLFIIETYRHGARYTNEDDGFWDAMQQEINWGELSITGVRQQYTLGQQMRDIYILNTTRNGGQFVSEQYNSSQIYVRSTDVNRTIMSAAAQLQGVYPIKTGPNLQPNVASMYTIPPFKGAQPLYELGLQALPYKADLLPIHMVAKDFDPLLSPQNICNNFSNFYEDYWQTAAAQEILVQINNTYADVYAQLDQVLGVPNGTVNYLNIEHLFTVFYCNLYAGLPLPPTLTPELFAKQFELVDLYYYGRYGVTNLTGLTYNYFFFKQVLKYLDAASLVNYSSPLRWVHYSCHDTDLVNMWYALNISDFQCFYNRLILNQTNPYQNCFGYPRFASSFVIELWNNEQNETEVKILVDGQYVYMCNSTEKYCPYQDFRQRLINYSFKNDTQWFEACGNEDYSTRFQEVGVNAQGEIMYKRNQAHRNEDAQSQNQRDQPENILQASTDQVIEEQTDGDLFYLLFVAATEELGILLILLWIISQKRKAKRQFDYSNIVKDVEKQKIESTNCL